MFHLLHLLELLDVHRHSFLLLLGCTLNILAHQQLAVLPVAARLLVGNTYQIQPAGGRAEDGVHLLETSICGLGEEEIDDGDNLVRVGTLAKKKKDISRRDDGREGEGRGGEVAYKGINDGKDDVGFVLDICEGDGRDHDHHELRDKRVSKVVGMK